MNADEKEALKELHGKISRGEDVGGAASAFGVFLVPYGSKVPLGTSHVSSSPFPQLKGGPNHTAETYRSSFRFLDKE